LFSLPFSFALNVLFIPELSDSIDFQEPISCNIKAKSVQAILTQWVKAFLVIPAKAGMTAGIKSTKNRSI
jgi:hypothetical protein